MVSTTLPVVVLRPEDHFVLGEAQFGMPGLKAIESIGPFVDIQASGPLITVHDSVVDARLGIGHHPHRFNERLFYIEEGQLDHDDALKDADAPRLDEADGVRTKELVGSRSPLRVNGDIRLFADSSLEGDAELTVELGSGEGTVVSVRQGAVELGDAGRLGSGTSVVAPPAEDARTLRLRAVEPARIVRVVHGPGHGFVTATRPAG